MPSSTPLFGVNPGRFGQRELFGDADEDVPHQEMGPVVSCERELISLALALGAKSITGWSAAEERLCASLPLLDESVVEQTRQRIQRGADPLGEMFCGLRAPDQRRSMGATYTPSVIVEAMLDWAADGETPQRVVDPGTGSGRYLMAAGERFASADLLGLEIDPLACLLTRANLSVRNLEGRSEILCGDFRSMTVPVISRRTLYIGNPPYVRHHQISPAWKRWFTKAAASRGLPASQLAGLHVHFFLATALHAAVGDIGIFVTPAEWMDVNYGSLVRKLLLGRLGGKRICILEPVANAFSDAATTTAITQFEIGSDTANIDFKRAENVGALHEATGARVVHRDLLASATRWSPLSRTARKIPQGYVELGELCRVHRGQVTGANKTWIAGCAARELPKSVLFATVTKARELFAAGSVLSDSSGLRQVIDLPVDLDCFEVAERRTIESFLFFARSQGAHLGYIGRKRKAWWTVGLRAPAPILATYMARRPPAFVRNRAGARHINIAHGLYPREPMSDAVLAALVDHLSRQTSIEQGRTYAGGLTKFEPREMERLLVPELAMLANRCA